MIDRWAWFDALVQRCVDESPLRPSAALADAVLQLGLSPRELAAAVGSVLGVAGSQVGSPSPHEVARVDGRKLAVLAGPLLQHRTRQVRAIAEAWLSTPAAAYQIPRDTLADWLVDDAPPARLLVGRLPREGLALLGAHAVRRVCTEAPGPIRAALEAWTTRLSPSC